MPFGIIEDQNYQLFGGIALSHASLPAPFNMPRPHCHRDYELFLLLDGGRKFFLANTICSLNANNAMLIPPNEPHQSTTHLNSHMERYAVYISPKLMDSIIKENSPLREILNNRRFQFSQEIFSLILANIKKIEEELKVCDELSKYYIKNLMSNTLLTICRNCKISDNENSSDCSLFEKNDIRLQTPINYILEHYNKQITLKKCADMAYMSISHFSRQFHLVTGMNFKEYVNKIRIEKACEFLKSDKKINITEIGNRVGFSNSSYFTYIFRTVTGLSPTQYRKNMFLSKMS